MGKDYCYIIIIMSEKLKTMLPELDTEAISKLVAKTNKDFPEKPVLMNNKKLHALANGQPSSDPKINEMLRKLRVHQHWQHDVTSN